ncbi:MAG: type II toxin-antitoxin system prevent-host-death family antitoxin [Nitrospirae bacterium]|nr:type II toxin-antitoxin system prevent-host-death family antitoxin [Nitrospirota bacterium]MBI3392680.1 type II toxin-antitoxin system prevent-host-death family antitoxin [Nitrospirota bacterium]
MIHSGVKQVRDRFTLYLKKVKEGEEVVITERGTPVAVIRPVGRGEEGPEARLDRLRLKGVFVPAADPSPMPVPRFRLPKRGKGLSDLVIEERAEAEW